MATRSIEDSLKKKAVATFACSPAVTAGGLSASYFA